MRVLWTLAFSAICLACVSGDEPKSNNKAESKADSGWVKLFNGENLDGWHTFLQQHGRDKDPDKVITIKEGMIHLYADAPADSKVVMGYISTDREYGDFHFRCQYRWGEKKFEPRLKLKKDAGLYYHIIGEDAVWPRSMQFQIQEGDVGDLLVLYGVQADTWIDPATAKQSQATFLDPTKGGKPVVLGGSGIGYQKKQGEHEVPGWNTLEIIVRGRSAEHRLNGKVINRCENIRVVNPTTKKVEPLLKGRIALEIEAAEIFYRNVEIRNL